MVPPGRPAVKGGGDGGVGRLQGGGQPHVLWALRAEAFCAEPRTFPLS